MARATGPTSPRRRAASQGQDPGGLEPVQERVGRTAAHRRRAGARRRRRAGRAAAPPASGPVRAPPMPTTPNRYRWPNTAALSRSSRSSAISAAAWPMTRPVDWHSAAIAAAWLYSRSSSSAIALVRTAWAGGSRPSAASTAAAKAQAAPDRAQALGPLHVEEGLTRGAAPQPPLDAPVLVPGEQVQVDDFLAAGHQAVVQRLHPDLADRAERELERLPAYDVRRVHVGGRLPRVAEPAGPGGGRSDSARLGRQRRPGSAACRRPA